jgi:hypothetical protein
MLALITFISQLFVLVIVGVVAIVAVHSFFKGV